MDRMREEGPLPRLDARLRRVGEWLLVGYTVALVLVTFVRAGAAGHRRPESSDAAVELFVG